MTESELKKKQCTKLVFDYLKIAVMAVLLALAYVLFIINNRFAPAGINGVATMIEYKLGFSVGYFSLIVNVPLSIVAFFYVDRDFALKSFAFTVIYSVSYILLEKADLSNFAYVANGTDTILPVLAAGIIGGFALIAPAFVIALKSVLLPTFGKPTTPNFILPPKASGVYPARINHNNYIITIRFCKQKRKVWRK